MKVLLEGPILTKSGYGEHARLVYKALKRRDDIEVLVDPLAWGQTTWEQPDEEIIEDIRALGAYANICNQAQKQPEFAMQIHVGIPNEFQKKAPYSICVTAGIETDRVAPSWLVKTHQGIDKFIVPSEHAKTGFVKTAYEIINQTNNTRTQVNCACPVDVIHYPVKSPEGAPLQVEFETDFNFLTIAMTGPRKNLEMTIRGFVEEFREDSNVGLVLKTSLGRSSIIDRQRTLKQIGQFVSSLGEKKCKIYLLHGDLSESEIHSLYTHPKIKAYVSTTHGEGYGLPIFEAAYSGMPVIATDWSGHLDFLSGPLKGKAKKLFARIDYDLKQVAKNAVWKDIITEESKWAYPSESSCKVQMRKVFSNYGMYKKWASILKQEINNNHKLDDILDKYNTSIFGNFVSNSIDVESLRSQAMDLSDVKDRAKFAKSVVSNSEMSQKDKLDFLKGLFRGETAYLVSCGPTLTDHDPDKIRDLLSKNFGISIKQAFDLFGENIDLHLYNCANHKQYDYSKHRPIVMEASTSPHKMGECDLKFFIMERDFNKSTAAAHNFEEWTFDKQPLLRPYGPGIEYEVVFFALEHLGFSEVITIGWDNKLIKGNADQQHFYDKQGSGFDKKDFIHSNEVAMNESAVKTLEHEEKITTDAMLPWYEWLKSKGTTLKIVSDINPAPDCIERLQIK
jgi:glycosyltransferase involved in cell wall biosynthesis